MCVVLNGKEKIVADANKNFIANMKKPAFVAAILFEAGVNKPPCVCCLKEVQKNCPHSVGELDCRDYVLYSESPGKVEHKVLLYIGAIHLQSQQRKKKLAA